MEHSLGFITVVHQAGFTIILATVTIIYMMRERAKLDMEREKYQKESMAEIMKVLQQEQQTFLLKVLHRNQDNDSN